MINVLHIRLSPTQRWAVPPRIAKAASQDPERDSHIIQIQSYTSSRSISIPTTAPTVPQQVDGPSPVSSNPGECSRDPHGTSAALIRLAGSFCLLEGNESGRVGGSQTGSTVRNGLVGDAVEGKAFSIVLRKQLSSAPLTRIHRGSDQSFQA